MIPGNLRFRLCLQHRGVLASGIEVILRGISRDANELRIVALDEANEDTEDIKNSRHRSADWC